MRLPKWLCRLFNCNTRFPQQQLTQMQYELLLALDSHLYEHKGPMPENSVLQVKSFRVSIWGQRNSIEQIIAHFHSGYCTQEGFYIPKSIALIVDPDGTWSFYYGIRTTGINNDITNELFVAAMNRTNDAITACTDVTKGVEDLKSNM